MKKVILFIFIFLLIPCISCKENEGKTFKSDELSIFLDELKNDNYTVKFSYDEIYNSLPLYNVTISFKITKINMLRNTTVVTSSSKEKVSIVDVYSTCSNNIYFDYSHSIYYEDQVEENKIKEEINESIYNKNKEYGTEFIFPQAKELFTYDEQNLCYTYKTFKIYLEGSIVKVYNTANNLKAEYSNIGTTKIKKPKFASLLD